VTRSWGSWIKNSVLFLATFLISLALAFRLDHAFRIQEVVVRGMVESVPFEGKDQYIGTHMWESSETEIRKYLQDANSSYHVTVVQKEIPGRIIVTISRLVPVAYLQLPDGYLLLSREGVVLEKQRDLPIKPYPFIVFYQNLPYNAFQKGSEIGYKEVEDSLYFLDIVQNARIKVNNIDISGFYMLGLYTDEGTFLFSSEKDRSLQQYQFEQAFKQVSLEGLTFKELDFRFDKPIIRI